MSTLWLIIHFKEQMASGGYSDHTSKYTVHDVGCTLTPSQTHIYDSIAVFL